MAHERITSEDVSADVIIHWNDDGMVVDLGLIWDDPDDSTPNTSRGYESQSDVTANADNESGTAQSSGVIERRVEGGPGGTIAVPVMGDPGAEANGLRSAPLQAYLDNEGRWSVYVQLDRPRINTLIRTLRRARNKAFGADE